MSDTLPDSAPETQAEPMTESQLEQTLGARTVTHRPRADSKSNELDQAKSKSTSADLDTEAEAQAGVDLAPGRSREAAVSVRLQALISRLSRLPNGLAQSHKPGSCTSSSTGPSPRSVVCASQRLAPASCMSQLA